MWSLNWSPLISDGGTSGRRQDWSLISCCRRLLGNTSSVQMYTAPAETVNAASCLCEARSFTHHQDIPGPPCTSTLPASSPPCCAGYCTDRQSCRASWVFPAPLSPDSSVTPPTGSPPLSSSSSTGQPTLSLRPDSSLGHSPAWSRMAAHTQTHTCIQTLQCHSVMFSQNVSGTWDGGACSAGGGSGGEQLADVSEGQTGESLQLQTRNTQNISDRPELSCKVKTNSKREEKVRCKSWTQSNTFSRTADRSEVTHSPEEASTKLNIRKLLRESHKRPSLQL